MTSGLDGREKLAIHELLSRAAFGLDERDLELLGVSFADDAEMTLCIAGGASMGPFVGRAGIMKLMADTLETQTDKRRHVVSNIFFEAESPDRATVVSYLTLMATENGEIALLSAGVYRDQVIKRDGRWQLWRRHLDLDKSY